MRWNAFPDPVHDSQRQFRRLLAAMAEPGTLHRAEGPEPPAEAAIGRALWATLLTLCDLDTRLWIAPGLEGGGLHEALAFHTGCRFAATPEQADFALVAPTTLQAADATTPAFAEGSDIHPELGTTLLVALESLEEGGPWRLTGPGIPDERHLEVGDAAPLMTRLAANRARFPRGLDAILACGERLAAIPRSTRIESRSTDSFSTDKEDVACMSQ